MADETPVKQKQREPITLFFGIILLAACILAIGIFISDDVLGNDDEKVTNSSTVKVNYTGSLYGYYDEGGMIFQTTVSSIDENTGYRHTSTYSFNDSTLSVDMSNPSTLKMFSDSLLGHKEGDTVRVAIPADQAYVKPETLSTHALTGMTAANNFYSASSDFSAPFGWTYTATYDDVKGMYLITYNMTDSKEVTVDGVKLTTSDFTYDADKVTYNLAISGAAKAKDVNGQSYTINEGGTDYTAIETIVLPSSGEESLKVIGAQTIDDSGNVSGSILMKTTGLIDNMPLFFVIEIVSVA